MYDRSNDVLYIMLYNNRGKSYADADSPVGIEIMRDMDTDEITGFVVYYATEEKKSRQAELKELGYDFQIDSILAASL